MFGKLKMTIFKKFLDYVEPNREHNFEKIGNKYFFINTDSLWENNYLFKGQYSYDEVVKLNEMTGYNASFGFCKEIGPVAIIGIPNPDCTKDSGYLRYKIHGYGEPCHDDEEYYYEACQNDEDAKGIGNYTVYGLSSKGFENANRFEGVAPLEEMVYFEDYRYKCKDESELGRDTFHRGVLRMEAKLAGKYSFEEARIKCYGSTKKPEGYSGKQIPLQFAIVNGNKPVAIMNMWHQYEGAKFEDVWEYGENEPEELSIRFLSDEEAKNIKEYEMYFFRFPFDFHREEYDLEKINRTFDRHFDFTMEDGSDYRLQRPKTVKSK